MKKYSQYTFQDKKELYHDLNYAYNVSGPYSPHINEGLIKHPREEEDQYTKRKTLGAFPKFLKLLIDQNTVRTIYRDPPVREFNNTYLEEFSKRVDSGTIANSLQIKMPRFLRQACLYGIVFIVGDNYKKEDIAGMTRSQLANSGKLPWFYSVEPQDVEDIVLDGLNIERFVWCVKTPDKTGKVVSVYRIWTAEAFYEVKNYKKGMSLSKVKEEDSIVKVDNEIGVVPVYPFMSVDEDLTESLPESDYNYALQLIKIIYNLTSWIIVNCQDTAFPIFYGPKSMAKSKIEQDAEGNPIQQASIDIGTTKGLAVPDESTVTPGFICAPAEPTEMMQGERKEAIELLLMNYAISWYGTNSAQQSGESKKQDKGVRNENLEYLAHRAEALELWMFDIVGKYMGFESTATVSYNTDYSNDNDVMEFLDMAITALSGDLNLAPDVKAEIKKGFISRWFSEKDPDFIKKMNLTQEKFEKLLEVKKSDLSSNIVSSKKTEEEIEVEDQ